MKTVVRLIAATLLLAAIPILGFSQEGELLRRDFILSADAPGKIEVPFTIVERGILNIRAGSIDFKPQVSISGPNGFSYSGEGYMGQSSGTVMVLPGRYQAQISSTDGICQAPRRVQLRISQVIPQEELPHDIEIRGQISSDSFRDSTDQLISWYVVTIPSEGTIQIRMESEDIDAVLTAFYPDGRTDTNDDYGSGTDSLLTISGKPGEQVFIGAGALYGDEGSYTISASQPEPLPEIGLGEMVQGQVHSSDGSRDVGFQFTAPKDGFYQINLTSHDFDTFLEVIQAQGQTLSNDDGGQNTDSQLSFPMVAGEVAQVFVSSYSGKGSFELMVALMPSPKEISLDEPVSENLSMGGLDRYTYFGSPNQMIRVQLGSSEFDTVLRVLTPTGFQLESDDASVIDQEQRWPYLSQIEYRFVEAGTLSIEVVGYDSEDQGVYELVVSEGDASQITEYDPELILQPGESITSYLPEDAVTVASGEGRIGHRYPINLVAGKTYEINLLSSSFDAYLEVSGPDGGYWENDDGPNGLNSQLVFTAPISGQYQVMVTSLAGESLGLYTLATATIELGSLILDTEGSLNSNRVEQEFNVSVTSAAELRVDLQSEAFDTRLSLLDPQGIIIAEDDDGGSNSNSLIIHSIDEPGIYTIRVMSFGQEGSGPFRLQVFSKLR